MLHTRSYCAGNEIKGDVKMTYKAGDLVYFDGDVYKGVGKIVSQHMDFPNNCLVHSTQIVNGRIMKNKVMEFISLQELAKYLGVEIYYDESKYKPYTLRVKEN